MPTISFLSSLLHLATNIYEMRVKKKTVDCIVCQQIGLKRPWHNYGMIMHRRLGKEGAEEVQ